MTGRVVKKTTNRNLMFVWGPVYVKVGFAFLNKVCMFIRSMCTYMYVEVVYTRLSIKGICTCLIFMFVRLCGLGMHTNKCNVAAFSTFKVAAENLLMSD